MPCCWERYLPTPFRVNPPVRDPSIARARALARLLDTAIRIPGTNIRFGLDPIIGLVPGLGDIASAMLSGYIVLSGIRLGASRSIVDKSVRSSTNGP